MTPEESNIKATTKQEAEKKNHPFLRFERGRCGDSESHRVVSLKPRLEVEAGSATTLRAGKILKFFSVLRFHFEFSWISKYVLLVSVLKKKKIAHKS